MKFRLLPLAWLLVAGCFYSFDNPVELQPVGSISGQVSLVAPAPGQTPAGGAVSILWSALTVSLSGSGRFILLDLPSGAYSLHYSVPPAGDAGNDFALLGERPGLSLPDVNQQADALDVGTLQLTASGTVGGMVSGALGSAVVSAFVPLADGGLGSFEGFSAVVQGDGSYSLSLPAGTHTLVAADAAQTAVVAASELPPGQSITTNFALAAAAGGGDVKGALVFGYPPEGDAATINSLAAGTLYVATTSDGTLVADGGLPLQGDVVGSGDAFDLQLPPGQKLTVTLVLTSSIAIPDGGFYPPLVLPGITTSHGLATELGQVTWLTDSQLCANGVGCAPSSATASSSGSGGSSSATSSTGAGNTSTGGGVSGSTGTASGTGGSTGGTSSGGSAGSPWDLAAELTGFDAGGEPLTVNAFPGPNGEPAMIYTASNSDDWNVYFWSATGGPPIAIFDAGGSFYFITTGWANNGSQSAAVIENELGGTTVVMQAITQSGGVWTPVPIANLPVAALVSADETFGTTSIVYDPLTSIPWLVESPRNLATYTSFVVAPLNGSGALYEGPGKVVPQYLSAIPCTNPWDGGSAFCIAYLSGTNVNGQVDVAIFDPSVVADGGAADGGAFQIVNVIPQAADAGFLELEQVVLTNAGNRAITVLIQGEASFGVALDIWSTFVPGVDTPIFNILDSTDGGLGAPTLLTWQNQPLLMLYDPRAYLSGAVTDADLLFFLGADDGGNSLPTTPAGLGATPTSAPSAYVDSTGNLVVGLAGYSFRDGGTLSLVTLPP